MASGSNPLRRTANVVDFVALSPKGAPLNDIAKALELPVSTVHRIVKSLVDIDYLVYDEDTKIYRLGSRLDRLFQLSLGLGSIAVLAAPSLKSLAEEFGEVAFIGRLCDRKVDVVALEMPLSREGTLVHPGHDLPLHATATGKALLAYQEKAFVDLVLASPLKRYLPGTLVDKRKLRSELTTVRQRGYAVHDAEYDEGVYALAVPVLSGRSQTAYAVAMVGFKDRMSKRASEAQIVQALSETSRQLSQSIARGVIRKEP